MKVPSDFLRGSFSRLPPRKPSEGTPTFPVNAHVSPVLRNPHIIFVAAIKKSITKARCKRQHSRRGASRVSGIQHPTVVTTLVCEGQIPRSSSGLCGVSRSVRFVSGGAASASLEPRRGQGRQLTGLLSSCGCRAHASKRIFFAMIPRMELTFTTVHAAR